MRPKRKTKGRGAGAARLSAAVRRTRSESHWRAIAAGPGGRPVPSGAAARRPGGLRRVRRALRPAFLREVRHRGDVGRRGRACGKLVIRRWGRRGRGLRRGRLDQVAARVPPSDPPSSPSSACIPPPPTSLAGRGARRRAATAAAAAAPATAAAAAASAACSPLSASTVVGSASMRSPPITRRSIVRLVVFRAELATSSAPSNTSMMMNPICHGDDHVA